MIIHKCPRGEIGRHKGLKRLVIHSRQKFINLGSLNLLLIIKIKLTTYRINYNKINYTERL